jgi:transposase
MARAVEAVKPLRCKLSRLQQKLAVRLYLNGKSGPVIASELDCGPDLIYKVLRHHGVEADKTGSRNRRISYENEDLLITLYLSGHTQTQLADRFGISQANVSQILKRTDTPTRRQPRSFSALELADIRSRYESGDAAGLIAEDYDVFHKRILVELRKMGAKIRKRPGFYTWTDIRGRVFTFKSLWELRVAQHFDVLGKKWDYEKDTYLVLLEDGTATYTPDFWVYADGGALEAVVDVKGRWWPNGQQEKVALFREQYPEIPFEIWDACVLKGSGVRLL